MAPRELTDRERRILKLEEQFPNHTWAKENSIINAFALTPARYYQILDNLIDEPAALATTPQVVYRLRKVREDRAKAKAVRFGV